jgi:acetylornithine deacetylase/succinyl-diaminopimelate desuccinylase-like protein
MDNMDTALAEEQQSDSALGQALEGVSPQELKAAAMLIGLSQFRDSMNRSGPFADDLALLQTMLGEKYPELSAEISRLAPYAEKGVLQLVLEGVNDTELRLSGGNAFNAVPDLAVYTGPRQAELVTELERLGYESEQGENGVRVLGKSAHAQATEEGVNAITRLALALLGIGLRAPTLEFIVNDLGADPFARAMFGECRDELSGRLRCNVGMLELGENARLSLDLRIPVSVEKDWVVTRLQDAAQRYGFSYQEREWLAPLYMPLDHFLIQTLLKVYREVTGDHVTQPFTAGGATYARAMANCVAFGAVFPDRPKVEHQPDEHIRLDDLYQAMDIYAQALYELTR